MDTEKVQIKHYNVGQADAHAITVGDSTVVIDGDHKGGAYQTSRDIQEDVHGQATLELVATHFDQDHVSGFSRLLDKLDVDRLYIPGRNAAKNRSSLPDLLSTADREGVPVRKVPEDAEELSISNRVHLNFLMPTAKLAEDTRTLTGNDGIVVNCRIGSVTADGVERTILFPGDLTNYFQRWVVDTFSIDVDGLVIPHHGSQQNLVADFNTIPPNILDSIEVSRERDGDAHFRRQLQNTVDSMEDVKKLSPYISSPVLKELDPAQIVISADPNQSYNHPDLLTLLTIYCTEIDPEVYATYVNKDITWTVGPNGEYQISTGDARTTSGVVKLIRQKLRS